MKNEFEVKDLILPMLKLQDPTPIKVKFDEKYLYLFIGSRDWQWNRETGEMIGAGTSLCNAFEGDAPSQVSEVKQ